MRVEGAQSLKQVAEWLCDPFPRLGSHRYTVFIRLQAKQFLHKSSLDLGKFEAVEGVLAYSQVFSIKKKILSKLKQ